MSVTTIVLLSLIAAFLIFRSKRDMPVSKKKASSPAQQKNPYNAAAIRHDDCACAAVQKIAKSRFLASEVPMIPMPDCTAKTCNCTYARYSDRRNMDTRRAPFSLESDLYASAEKPERRELHARRTMDNDSVSVGDFNYDEIEWIS